jgi:serine/threonine-protein kinase HipA
LQVSELVKLASDVLAEREGLSTTIEPGDSAEAIAEILLVGSCAGGARAKAVIAYNPQTGVVRSGELDAPAGFVHRTVGRRRRPLRQQHLGAPLAPPVAAN